MPIDVIILTLFSLLITAAFFYLPNHILVVSNRIWYYIHGDFYEPIATKAGESSLASEVATTTKQLLMQTAEHVLRARNEL